MDYFRAMEVFTLKEIQDARAILRTAGTSPHDQLKDEIIVPALARINRVTRRTNDPDYLAYVLEYVASIEEREGTTR